MRLVALSSSYLGIPTGELAIFLGYRGDDARIIMLNPAWGFDEYDDGLRVAMIPRRKIEEYGYKLLPELEAAIDVIIAKAKPPIRIGDLVYRDNGLHTSSPFTVKDIKGKTVVLYRDMDVKDSRTAGYTFDNLSNFRH